jgi:hypothetical protein
MVSRVNQPAATTDRIIGFLETIGIPTRDERLEIDTVLPGVTVREGTLLVDVDKLLAPGDLLHEAGHLAVLTPQQRQAANVNLGTDGGYEMAAIAWSWAAVCELNLDPAVVFHADGYKRASGAIIENFVHGRYVGVPILQWLGLAAQGDRATELGVDPYPAMIRWVL